VAQAFGFAQFEFAGRLAVPDGRYLVRGEGGDESQRVLVVETIGAPSPPPRRRRRPKQAQPGEEPAPLSLTRATAVRAHEPFADAEEAGRWLAAAVADEETLDALIGEGIALLNRALHAQAAAAAEARGAETSPERAVTVRVGYGSGEEVAAGRFAEAHRVDPRSAVGSRRRQREEEMRPQERLAAVLGGREQIDACETLLLRARADLDAGRRREAALQLRIALEAMLVDLAGALADPGHTEDMATLESRRAEAGEAANLALRGDLDDETEHSVRQLIETAERVLRRRRVLRG
jgi:hypothetical protein